MRYVLASLLVMGVGFFLASGTGSAQDKEKQVTLKGSITCGKCDLGVDKKCATVIVVKAGDKETVYYFDAASHKAHHDGVCTEAKKGSVDAVVTDDGKKKVISVKKLTFDK